MSGTEDALPHLDHVRSERLGFNHVGVGFVGVIDQSSREGRGGDESLCVTFAQILGQADLLAREPVCKLTDGAHTGQY